MSSYWLEQGGVIVDNIAKYAAACHAAGREAMNDDDAQFEARMRLDALYASISKALDNAEARGAAREREKWASVADDLVGCTIYHDTAGIMPQAMSHMKASDFAKFAQRQLRAMLSTPEAP
jgi:hypothetical protein